MSTKTGFPPLFPRSCGREQIGKSINGQEKKTVGINPGKHILSGKLVCGLCGAPFYRTTRKRKHDQICQWKCRTYLEQGRTKPGKEGGCDNIHLEENGLFSFLANSIFTNSSCCEAEELLAKIFLKLLKECLQETRQKEQAHSQQYHQKLRQQQSLLLEKYLEGLIDESLYKEKQLDLQSKIQEQNIRNIPKENSHRSSPRRKNAWKRSVSFSCKISAFQKPVFLACWKL